MEWETYKLLFSEKAKEKRITEKKKTELLQYAKFLHDKGLPIIMDQKHLALLIGIDGQYLHAMCNKPNAFYRSFKLSKKTGGYRTIDEPLPDLKLVQKWILANILYKCKTSRYAKAYIKNVSIKENIRYHRNQKVVVALDIKNFFGSISSFTVLDLFKKMGYNDSVSTMLTFLCCFRGCLPQGAPTSAYISNLVLSEFDEIVASYCRNNRIRYTRYADDLTFSGDVEIKDLILFVRNGLKANHLKLNRKKIKVMNYYSRQIVTGVIVNNKQQGLAREYRYRIKQELYYIYKYGLDAHLEKCGLKAEDYLRSLLGKINYGLFINHDDELLKKCREKCLLLMEADNYNRAGTLAEL